MLIVLPIWLFKRKSYESSEFEYRKWTSRAVKAVYCLFSFSAAVADSVDASGCNIVSHPSINLSVYLPSSQLPPTISFEEQKHSFIRLLVLTMPLSSVYRNRAVKS